MAYVFELLLREDRLERLLTAGVSDARLGTALRRHLIRHHPGDTARLRLVTGRSAHLGTPQAEWPERASVVTVRCVQYSDVRVMLCRHFAAGSVTTRRRRPTGSAGPSDWWRRWPGKRGTRGKRGNTAAHRPWRDSGRHSTATDTPPPSTDTSVVRHTRHSEADTPVQTPPDSQHSSQGRTNKSNVFKRMWYMFEFRINRFVRDIVWQVTHLSHCILFTIHSRITCVVSQHAMVVSSLVIRAIRSEVVCLISFTITESSLCPLSLSSCV